MTSKTDLPDAPAFRSLRPRPPRLVNLGASELVDFRAVFGHQLVGANALYDGRRRLEGKFLVELQDARLFVKTVPADRVDNARLADKIALAAAAGGADCLTLFSGFPRRYRVGEYLLGFAYLEHRFSKATKRDLLAIGVAMGAMHAGLEQFAAARAVAAASQRRLNDLERTQELVEHRAASVRELVPEQARETLQRNKLDIRQLIGDRPQVIHGDLNYGNICFSKEAHAPYFIDFETATLSYLRKECDLAQVLDRFILTAPSHRRADLVRAMLEGYTTSRPAYAADIVSELLSLVEQLSVRSLLLLVRRRLTGLPVALTEWNKFTGAFARVADLRQSLGR